MTKIEDLRKKIDEVDEEIARSYLKRLALSEEMAKAKGETGLETYDPEREKEIVSRLTEGLGERQKRAIIDLYAVIFAESKAIQEETRKEEREG